MLVATYAMLPPLPLLVFEVTECICKRMEALFLSPYDSYGCDYMSSTNSLKPDYIPGLPYESGNTLYSHGSFSVLF